MTRAFPRQLLSIQEDGGNIKHKQLQLSTLNFFGVTQRFPQRYPSFDGLKSARRGYGMGMIASHFWRLVHSIYRGPLLSNSCCKNQHISSRFSYIEETFGSKVGGVTPRFPRRYPEISTGLPRIFHGVTPKFHGVQPNSQRRQPGRHQGRADFANSRRKRHPRFKTL